MQLQTTELMSWTDTQYENSGPILIRVLRHTLVYPSGLIYYQDEYVKHYVNTNAISSERTPWNRVDAPASPDEPVGTFEYGGLFGAIMRSGKTYLYAAKRPNEDDEDEKIAYQVFLRGHRIHEWPHEWVSISDPLPETIAQLARRV